MKKSILNILWSAMLASMLLLGGCQEPDEVITPNFPEAATATVMAGEKFEFTITPNMQWTLKIPTEATTHFSFLKGASELYTLRGTAGEQVITVQVSDKEEFDINRTCAIEMTMGEETRVIMTLTRSSKERMIKIYNCDFDTTEEMFVTDEDGAWVFSTTAADRIDWVWSNEQWMQRILVDANFAWTLGANTPQWLISNATNGKAGQTELFLRIDREYLPLENVTCNIEFCDASDRNGDGKVDESDILVVGSYPTEMEGCKDVCEVDLASELIFNANGEYYQASSDYYGGEAYGQFNAPRGAEIFAVVEGADGAYTTEGAEWILFTIEEYPSEAGEEGVWERSITIATEPHDSTVARVGAIVALPKTVAEAGNANYADYVVSTITQEGVVVIDTSTPIVAYNDDLMKGYAAKFETLEEGTWPWNGAWASIPHAFKLTYRDNASGSELIFNRPFSRYAIYGYDGLSSGQYEDLESCWLTLEESPLTDNEGNAIENAYKIRSRLGEWLDEENEIKYENTLAGSNGANRAVFVFYDANNNPFALLYFVLDPSFSPFDKVEGNVMIVDMEEAYRNGVSIVELVEGDAYYSAEDNYVGTLQYLVTLTSKQKSVELTVPQHAWAWSYKSWITVNSSDTSATITIKPSYLPKYDAEKPDSWPEEVIDKGTYKGHISFYGSMSSTSPSLQLHVIYKE